MKTLGMTPFALLAGLSALGLAAPAYADDAAVSDDQASEPAPTRTEARREDEPGERKIGSPSQDQRGAALAGPSPGAASQPLPATTDHERQTLTGDWWGLRSRLVDDGITFRADYVSETLGVVQGGLRKGTAYAQQLRGGVDLDMDKIVGWKGGKLHFTVNDRKGVGTSSDYVGNRLPIQEVYGGLYTKLTELTVEQDFDGGKLNVRAGYFAMGNDMGGIAAGCNFVNAAFCAHPLSMSGNTGWYNYPNARWGIAFRAKLRNDLTLRVGVDQVNPQLSVEHNAFRIFAGGTTGVLLPVELEYTPGHNPGDHWLPGSYKLGFIYDTSNVAKTGRSGKVGSRQGYYLLVNQQVLRERGNKRSLGVIAAYTLNPRASAQITRWYTLGLIQTGTFKGRDQDTFNVGVVKAVVNPRLREAYADTNDLAGGMDSLPQGETAFEVSYGIQVNHWMILRPDVQYIADPGAFSYANRKDAIAAGAQVKIQF
ncbi:carbohydrate porin [Novosphingobium sp. 9]|uniref:carbohydrate porin n=1 Tax=Novosphingobium sp. 9 TaxID=2025349 RepID=UPI0021B5EF12|nr:carbohydrate porin [Novosphingobium sp. 9]